MEMKKISKTRWMIICAVPIVLLIIFMSSGCAMLEDQMNTMKGLVGMGYDPIVVETPVCEGETCVEDIRG